MASKRNSPPFKCPDEGTAEHTRIWQAIEALSQAVATLVDSHGTVVKRLDAMEQIVEPIRYIADTMKGLRIGAPVGAALITILVGLKVLGFF